MSISVIMPNYNHEKYLEEALDAILNQSYPASEIILVDDASTDNSVSLVKRYCLRYPQIKLYTNEKNSGPVVTINRAISLSTGDYLVFCAADDRVLPGFFEKAQRCMQEHPDIALCTSYSRYFKDNGHFKDDDFSLLGSHVQILQPQEVVSLIFFKGFYIPSHTSMYKRSSVIQAGCLIKELRMFSDFYLNYKIAFNNKIGLIPEVLASLRVHESSYSASVKRQKKEKFHIYKVLCDILQKENKSLQECFRKSAILANCGLSFCLYLCKRPRFWPFMGLICLRKGRNRIKSLIAKMGFYRQKLCLR